MAELHFYLEVADEQATPDQRYMLTTLPCSVGRGSDCGLHLDFDRISRCHAQFEEGAGGLLITDLDSTNGTFVNHERINAPTLVRPGDVVHLANHAFYLRHQQSTGSTMMPLDQRGQRSAGDTVIGFTALPTGFPVQAPEFFELLNDELITGTTQAIKTTSGMLVGQDLRGRGTHPKLAVNPQTLFRLAEDLGEEVRLAQMIRRICLEQASDAGLQASLFIEVHPVECEDPETLSEELTALIKRFRHLDLVIELPFHALDQAQVASIPGRLERLEGTICARTSSPADVSHRNLQVGAFDMIRLPAAIGPESIAELAARLSSSVRILIDGIDDPALIAVFEASGAALFQGSAVGQRSDIV